MARYSKYTNVDANSAHQRFCELCSKHTARNAVFSGKPPVTAVTDLARFKQTHQLLSITVGPPGQQTMGSMCWWISEPYAITKSWKMKDGGTGRRGEMNLSLQKASETGLRGTDGEEVGVSPSVCYAGECKRVNLLDEWRSARDCRWWRHSHKRYLMTRFIQVPPNGVFQLHFHSLSLPPSRSERGV